MHPQQSYDPAPPPGNPYDFIENAGQGKKQSPFSGSSLAVRILIILGGALVLLLIVVVAKNMLGGNSSNYANLVGIVQQQQELIHLSTDAQQQPTISGSNKNLAITTEFAITSAQSQLLAYLQTGNKKMDRKLLGLKISAKTDALLLTAVANSTYDTELQQVLETKLTTYQQSLSAAYDKTDNPMGRKLLNKQHAGAKLLIQQLESAKS